MTLQEIFVENLESEMAKKNVTYYQISKNTNIAHSTFSKWKSRKANPTIDTLLRVRCSANWAKNPCIFQRKNDYTVLFWKMQYIFWKKFGF